MKLYKYVGSRATIKNVTADQAIEQIRAPSTPDDLESVGKALEGFISSLVHVARHPDTGKNRFC
jgi:hypothetical protein